VNIVLLPLIAVYPAWESYKGLWHLVLIHSLINAAIWFALSRVTADWPQYSTTTVSKVFLWSTLTGLVVMLSTATLSVSLYEQAVSFFSTLHWLHWAFVVILAAPRAFELSSQCHFSTVYSGRLAVQASGGVPWIQFTLLMPLAYALNLITATSSDYFGYVSPRTMQWIGAVGGIFYFVELLHFASTEHRCLTKWIVRETRIDPEDPTAPAKPTTLAKVYLEFAPLVDSARLMFVEIVMVPIAYWMVGLASSAAPTNLKYYMHDKLVASIPGVDIGIAYAAIPDQMTEKPSVLICNMGYMDGAPDPDRLYTSTTTMRMLDDLVNCDPKETGFAGDIVCEFSLTPEAVPRGGKQHTLGKSRQGRVRQVNLSAWSSVKASHDWYVNSPAHKEIVAMHHAGEHSKIKHLNTFSAALIQAECNKPPRYHVRCTKCHHMNTKGYPENNHCSKCNEEIFTPLF